MAMGGRRILIRRAKSKAPHCQDAHTGGTAQLKGAVKEEAREKAWEKADIKNATVQGIYCDLLMTTLRV